MSNELAEKHLTKSCELRNKFWSRVGKVDSDVVSHLINPAFMGGPQWPSLRQAFVTVRKGTSTIIASDGLSDPFADPDAEEAASYNGYGLELYVETAGNLDPVIGSWQFEVLWQMSQNAANMGNLQPLLQKHTYLTTELYDVNAPKEFINEAGRVGVLLGLQNTSVPKNVQLSLETVDIVNVKLLTLKELAYVVERGADGRNELAKKFMLEKDPTYSDLKRKSVV